MEFHELPGFEELYSQMNCLVANAELDGLEVKKVEADQARIGAEQCGCHSCRSAVEAALARVRQEIARLTKAGVDIQRDNVPANAAIIPYQPPKESGI